MKEDLHQREMSQPPLALHRFAVVCVVATFALIFVGGLVTSTGSALAVPDWPLAYGHLIPKLEGGVRFEYGHRVVAGIVVILTTILAIWSWYAEPRRWVRNVAFAALGLVVVQGVAARPAGQRLTGVLGIAFILGLGVALSRNRRAISR